jgi:hypothetical protein
MNTAWKYVTVGIAAIGFTVVSSSVMTAYVMRPSIPDAAVGTGQADVPARNTSESLRALPERPSTDQAPPHTEPAPQPAYRRTGPQRSSTAARTVTVASTTASRPVTPIPAAAPEPPTLPETRPEMPAATSTVSVPPSAAPAPPVVAEHKTTPPLPPPVITTPVTPAPPTPAVEQPAASRTASVPADCATGSDRAMRIAKPGALGGLLGAALGAAGGAIANGGKGAGQGALIGAGVGAVAGGGYGAYKTKEECGTVLGDPASNLAGERSQARAGGSGAFPGPVRTAEAPFQSRNVSRTGDITIYDAR